MTCFYITRDEINKIIYFYADGWGKKNQTTVEEETVTSSYSSITMSSEKKI